MTFRTAKVQNASVGHQQQQQKKKTAAPSTNMFLYYTVHFVSTRG